MRHVLILNGPNLNLLGTREPDIYGHGTLDEIGADLHAQGAKLGISIDLRQSNHEGHLVDWLQEAGASEAHAVILNAAAFTHTSIAIRDAIVAIATPVIEVHISNTQARESFRRRSMIGAVCTGSIVGFGTLSYTLALDAAARL